MVIANIIAFVILAIGGINWGLVALFDFNLVSFIAGQQRNLFTCIIYTLVLISTIWLIISLFINGGVLYFMAW